MEKKYLAIYATYRQAPLYTSAENKKGVDRPINVFHHRRRDGRYKDSLRKENMHITLR